MGYISCHCCHLSKKCLPLLLYMGIIYGYYICYYIYGYYICLLYMVTIYVTIYVTIFG